MSENNIGVLYDAPLALRGPLPWRRPFWNRKWITNPLLSSPLPVNGSVGVFIDPTVLLGGSSMLMGFARLGEPGVTTQKKTLEGA